MSKHYKKTLFLDFWHKTDAIQEQLCTKNSQTSVSTSAGGRLYYAELDNYNTNLLKLIGRG